MDFSRRIAPTAHYETKVRIRVLGHISIPIIGSGSLAGLVTLSQNLQGMLNDESSATTWKLTIIAKSRDRFAYFMFEILMLN
jgi:hypothetical protein